jgi:hypothetical protein
LQWSNKFLRKQHGLVIRFVAPPVERAFSIEKALFSSLTRLYRSAVLSSMKAFLAILAAAAVVPSFAQGTPLGGGVLKFRLIHADPWAVKSLLQGMPLISPEISTVLGFAGVPDQESQLLKQFLGEGRLQVNPTDNSILWIPKRG